MSFKDIHIHHLRNISSARFQAHPKYNFILGANGSGKTTCLEAISLLSLGHSFRAREALPLIEHQENLLTVFGRTFLEETVSIQKSTQGKTQVYLNSNPCRNSSELARFLPCQIFYQDIFLIMDSGPSVRRSLIDWGLFHVKQNYLALWKEYRRVLKQRNTLLRQKAKRDAFIPWDKLLVEAASALDAMRKDYFLSWQASFRSILPKLIKLDCEIEYFKGWDRRKSGNDLASILQEQFESDRQRQFTQSGAHQADILFKISSSSKAKQILSRGQQKMILMALKFSQTNLLTKPCLYLIDDLAAELDNAHIDKVLALINGIQGQFFITALDDALVDQCSLTDFSVFKLEHGSVEYVSRETCTN